MNCIINSMTKYYLGRGKSLDVIAKYLKLKYKITVDLEVLRKRATQGFSPLSLG